jgi:ribonucleoside-diphosphate reductase alpha chain
MRELSANAKKVLETRYLIKDDLGKVIETPEGLFRRVAKAVASAEKTSEDQETWEKAFFEMMSNLEFIPNTPTLLNAGREGRHAVLSACFVLPIPDSLDGIFNTVYRSAILHQSGAGTGYSFSRLRPKGSMVSGKTGVSSGPVSFMKVFNAAVEEIKQGNTRRGALMMILGDSHPDIFEFVQCKMDESQIRNANISVAATDAFMEAVEKDADWVLSHPTLAEKRTIKARELWNRIIECAWAKGDPGLFFIDEANRFNPVPHVYKIESTNPCGEVPLGPNEACNLGSINLRYFVDPVTKEIMWEQLFVTTTNAVRFLDNVISISRLPFPEMEAMQKGNRKIGLGVMGLHDMLLSLGIRYDSQKALDIADSVAKYIQEAADSASIILGSQKGSFSNFKGSICEKKAIAMRNSTRTVIAPTGTISLIANESSSGIEPVFAFVHKSNRMDTQMQHNHWFVEQWTKENPGKPLPSYCIESHQIDPEWHIRMQAVWQKYVNDAVSKTINLPNSATKVDIEKAYVLAWKLKCKGITVYRDGCRQTGQVLETEATKKILQQKPVEKPAFGDTSRYYELGTGYGDLHVHIAHKSGRAYRVFNNLPPIGTEISGLTSVLGIVISKYLERGGTLEELIKHLGSVTGDRPVGMGSKKVLSIPHALATIFRDFLRNNQAKQVDLPKVNTTYSCPECQSTNIHSQEGCNLCQDCGYSACS